MTDCLGAWTVGDRGEKVVIVLVQESTDTGMGGQRMDTDEEEAAFCVVSLQNGKYPLHSLDVVDTVVGSNCLEQLQDWR